MPGALMRCGATASVGVGVLLVVTPAPLFAPPVAAAAELHPTLTLSRAAGAAGTRVIVTGHGCVKPFAERDTLAWHDHFYEMHDIDRRPPLGVWRSIPVQRLSATTLRAVFLVRKSDHLGRGILDLFCGGNGNAVASFTVTR